MSSQFYRKMRSASVTLAGCLLFFSVIFMSGCAGSAKADPQAEDAELNVKIDCEQEANKYRKPCRGDRFK